MLNGLNHITLAVRNLDKSLDFYVALLGFTPNVRWDRGAYLTLGDLWLCLSVNQSCPATDDSHLAFNFDGDDFAGFVNRLKHAGVRQWKTNNSEGDSFYFLDPDGHKLEIHVGSLQTRLKSLQENPYNGTKWLQRN